MEDIERSFVCLCDHPFHPDFGPSFMSCKTTIESVFDSIIQMRQTDRTDYCNMLNPPHVFGIGNSNSRNGGFLIFVKFLTFKKSEFFEGKFQIQLFCLYDSNRTKRK